MAFRIDQLLTPNHGAFDLINVKSPYVPDGGGGGGGGVALTTGRCINFIVLCMHATKNKIKIKNHLIATHTELNYPWFVTRSDWPPV